MTQKIIRVGNSAAVLIPAFFLKEAGFAIGDEIAVEYNGKIKMFFGKPKELADKTTLTPEFKEWLDRTMEEYGPILKKLAHL